MRVATVIHRHFECNAWSSTMKKTATVLGAAAAAAMIAAPVAAAERYSAPVAGENEIGLEGSGLIIGLLAAAAVIVGIILITDSDDEDDAVSP